MSRNRKDLNYTETGSHRRLAITSSATTPDIVKRAVTLILFSKDPDIRNFEGQSIMTAFSRLTQSSFSAISFYLIVAAKRLKTILSELDSRVVDVYFECVDNAPALQVTLNIKLADDLLTTVIYSE